MKTTRELFRERVKAAGGATKVAILIGCSRPFIYQLATGPKLPGREVAAAIERHLKISTLAWSEADVPVEPKAAVG